MRIRLKISILISIFYIIGCSKDKGISANEFEDLKLPFSIMVISFNLNGDPLISSSSQMYEYNRNDKQWHNIIGAFPTGLPFGTLYPLGNDLQGNYYGATNFGGNVEAEIWRLKKGETNWTRFKIPGFGIDTLPDFSHYYTFAQNQKGEIVMQRRVFVNAFSPYKYELFKKDANTDNWTLIQTRDQDNMYPIRFCSNGSVYFEGINGIKILKSGTTTLVNESDPNDINYISLNIQTGYRYVNEQGDIFYHTTSGVSPAIYKFDGNSTFPTLPTTESNNLEFPGNAGPPYSCNIKGFVYRNSDKSVPFYGTCSQYPKTMWYLFKRKDNKWYSAKENQSQLSFISNRKDEVYILYYGSKTLLKWNY